MSLHHLLVSAVPRHPLTQQTIRMMLRRNFHQRPSATELIQLPYVRTCLELSKSALVEVDRARAAPENTVKPTTTKR